MGRAAANAFRAAVSDFNFIAQQGYLTAATGIKAWGFMSGANTAFDLDQILDLVVAEHPHAVSARLQVRSVCTNIFNNMLPGRTLVEEIPCRFSADNTFTTTSLLAAWVTDWTRSYSAIPSPGTYEYYQWPSTHTYENTAFWKNRGVKAGRTRVLSIPGGGIRKTTHKSGWTFIDNSNWASIAAGNTFIAKKSVVFHHSVMGQTMNTCDVFDGPSTEALPNPVTALVNVRQMIKYEYRWINENRPTINGEIRPVTYVPDAPYTAMGMGPGRYQMGHPNSGPTNTFPDGAADPLLQQVNANPITECNGNYIVVEVNDPV